MISKLHFTFLIAIIGICSTVVFAQTPMQTPPPIEVEDDVVKISVNLVQVDATVTDKKGRVVEGLTADDFEIYENGKKQDITNLSFIKIQTPDLPAASAADRSAAKEKGVIAPPPSVPLRPEQVRRTYAIVVDDLGLSFDTFYFVKKAIQKFVDEQMQEGDLVAILRVSRGIGALQSFTSDRRVLRTSIDKLNWNANSRVGVNSYEPIRESLKEALNGRKKSDGSVSSVAGLSQELEAEARNKAIYDANSAIGTLGALNYVIRGMSELPGRKSLMLFSEGFSNFDYDGVFSGRRTMPEINKTLQSMRAVAELANRSAVTIHTIDPRGMTIPRLAQAADDIQTNSQSAARAVGIRDDITRDTQNSLRYLADETGGVAYVDRNDIGKGIRQVLDYQNRGYYLIAYEPDSESFDPNKVRDNKITVKVRRADLEVQHRSGFFGITDEKYKAQNPLLAKKITAALVSPFGANDVDLDAYSIYYNDRQNQSYIRSFVYINPNSLTFSLDPDGTYRGKFDVVSVIFDSNGAATTNGIKTQNLKFTKTEFDLVKKNGILYNLITPVDKSGGFQFRIALQDAASGRIGAASQYIELPDLKNKKLTLSSIILKNYSLDQWKKISKGQSIGSVSDTGILLDTVSRQFKRGSILNYYFVVYNARKNIQQKTDLQIQTRLFRDGKLVVAGQPSPIDTTAQVDQNRIEFVNAVTLGTDLAPGNYILQMVVTDNLGSKKNKIATQSIDFEIGE